MKLTSIRVALRRTGSPAMMVPTLRDSKKCADSYVVNETKNLTALQPIGSIVFC